MSHLQADLQRYYNGEQSAAAWTDLWSHEEPPEEAALSAEFVFASPLPVAHAADFLVLTDRAFRYALRCVDTGETPETIVKRGSAVYTRDGLRLYQVSEGSMKFRLDGSDRIFKALQSRPVAYTTALLTILGLLNLEPHIEFGPGHPTPQAPIVVVQQPPTTIAPGQPNPQMPSGDVPQPPTTDAPTFSVTVEVDGESVVIHVTPPPR